MTLAEEEALLRRITTNPEIFGGKPIVRGMRMPVDLVLAQLANGATHERLIEEYPWLEPEDIRACLLYATRLARRGGATPTPLWAEEPRAPAG